MERRRGLSSTRLIPAKGGVGGCSWLCLACVTVTHPIQAGILWSVPVGLGAGAGGSALPTRCCPSRSPSAPFPAGANGPWYISRDWRGVPSRLDAAMAGRLYVASQQPRRRKSRRQRKRYNHHRSLNLGFWSWLQNDPDSAGVESDGLSGSTCEMLQSVYFFVGGESGPAGSRNDAGPGLPGHGEDSSLSAISPSSGMQWEGAGSEGWQLPRAGDSPDSRVPFPPDKYYRVNLRTKHVDLVRPRYPRSIAQYWLDCPQPGEEST